MLCGALPLDRRGNGCGARYSRVHQARTQIYKKQNGMLKREDGKPRCPLLVTVTVCDL